MKPVRVGFGPFAPFRALLSPIWCNRAFFGPNFAIAGDFWSKFVEMGVFWPETPDNGQKMDLAAAPPNVRHVRRMFANCSSCSPHVRQLFTNSLAGTELANSWRTCGEHGEQLANSWRTCGEHGEQSGERPPGPVSGRCRAFPVRSRPLSRISTGNRPQICPEFVPAIVFEGSSRAD